MKLMQDMQSRFAEAAGDGGMDAEAMFSLQREMEAAIRGALSPEEFREYELRMSMTANTLRSQLAGFDPTEAKFLKVHDLRKAFDDEFSMFGRGNEADSERVRREAAEAQLKEARRIRRDTGLTAEQRGAALEGIRAETERSLKAVLGDKDWEQYNRGHNTYWLKNLVPPSGTGQPGS